MPSEGDVPEPNTSGPHRTHPLTAVTGFLAFGFGLVLVVTTAGVGFDLVLTLLGGFSLLRWWFRTYEVGPDELVVRDGVLSRRLQVVPYRRVQQVDIRRSLFMQLFGLAALRIETAGAGAGTVDLAMLDTRTADSLRSWVLSRRAAGDPVPHRSPVTDPLPAGPVPELAILRIDGGRLLLSGATSVAVTIAGALTIATVPAAFAFSTSAGIAAFTLSFFLALATVAVAVVSAIVTVMHYAGYHLVLAGEELRLTHGALERRHVTMPRARVQHIEITDNPLRRALGVASVSIRSAAPIGGAIGRVDIPIVKRSEVAGLLAAMMGDQTWTPPPLQPRSAAARRRGIVRRTAVPLAFAAILLPLEPVAGIVATALALVGIPWGRAAHRRAGFAVTPSITAFGAGVVNHRLHLVPIERIQSAHTVQSPFQRRVNLTTLKIDIAGTHAAPGLYDLDVPTAAHMRRALPRGAREVGVTP